MNPTSLTTSGTYAQVGRSTTREDLNYSSLGPVYETVDPGRHKISNVTSEGYGIHNMEADRKDLI